MIASSQKCRNGSLRTMLEFHFLLFIILVMDAAISPVTAKPTNNESENLSTPTRSKRSSTGNKEIIDLEETACRPKYNCASQRASSSFKIFEDLDSSFTDYVNENQNTSPISVADLVELPSDKELEDKLNEPFFAAIEGEQSEDDNPFIKAMKDQCAEDAFVYCAGDKYKSINHTMCRFCGLGEKCPYYLDPYNNQVTGRVIEDQPTIDYILKLHNEVRSKIARGWCDQPKAGCMGPVQWDPELARVAQKWADQCTNVDYNNDILRKDPWLFHDKHANRKTDEFSNWQGTGQNVARDIAKGEAGKFDAQKLVGHWFNQILYFDSEGVKSFGSGKQCSQGIGYYTQLVWQDTTHVGCGWIQFNYRGFKDYYENFLVCNYGPSANIWEQPVYDIAEETCNCPCIGCDKETGLCPANCNYAVWSSWEEWSQCSKSCDGGVRNRERDCKESNFPPKETQAVARLVEAHGSLDLVPLFGNDSAAPVGLRQSQLFGTLDPKLCLRGEQENQGECNTEGCPQWTQWGKWSECSASCGGGQQKRLRQCRYPNKPLLFADGKCPGEPSETRVCNDAATVPCPELSEWSSWSECTKTCESGERTRERTCDESKDADNPCKAVLVEKETCNTQLCPLFNEWSEWTECSATCGGGGQSRERNCYDPNFRLKCDGEPQQTRACNVQPCPNWSPWSEWTTCSATCGGGQRNRQRQCELPDGTVRSDSECGSESSNESGTCNEDVICPEWTSWSQWSECSVSCGGGEQQRLRSCEVNGQVFTSDNGNAGCPGEASEIQECNDAESVPCPELGEWSEWSQCSVTCGGGDRSRTRECGIPSSNPITSASVSASANPCKQPLFESERCNNDRCPVFTPWTEWSECSATCDGGNQRRTRQCVPANSRLFCEGDSEEEQQCNINPCPLWMEWSSWSECSYTCGGGTRQKTRECVLPNGDKVEDSLCGMGPATDEETCNTNRCPELGPWTDWSPCTVTCGGGEKVRTRECGLPQLVRDDNPCKAELTEKMLCHPEPCPTLTEWGTWSECSHTCGGGFRQKTRECIEASDNDVTTPASSDEDENPCMEPLEVIEGCNEATCPVWSVWGDWTVCSKTCGGGRRTRYRQCTDPATGQEAFCPGSNEESEDCNSQDCPYFTEWTKWTECSQSCGGGTRSKVRECIVSGNEANEVDGANLCDGDTQYQEACNEDVPCPVWSEWTDWGQCTATCGGGTEKRIRDCLLPAARNGNGTNLYGCDGDTWEMRNCNEHNCPTWTEWTEFTTCSKSCGGGRRVKTRECSLPPNIPAPALALFCPGDEKVIEDCNTEACPKPTEWSEWGECSVSCGGGLRQKTRECVNFRDANGNPCNEDLVVEEACNEQPCPVWTEWTEWTPCTKTCDKGRKKRARECLLLTRSDCPGESEELEDCNPEPCPTLTEWSEWTDCTQSCGGGNKRRVRDCLSSVSGFDASACEEALEEQETCNDNQCPEYSEWSEWTTCTADCGGGTQSHIRECLLDGKQTQEDVCKGDPTEQVPCNENVECPMWTEWNSWGDCSVTCGQGTRQRGRECARPVDFNGKLMCDGDTYETGPCESSVPPCPMWSEWTEWSECSKDCGGGYRTHVRVCSGGNEVDENGKSACGFGDFEESESCNKEIECPEQPMWSQWSEWGGCSQTCGGGSKERTRQCGSSDGVTGCAGPSQGMMFCNLENCPTDAEWSPWGEWSQCSSPCGGGDRSRRRTCESESSNGYGPPPECPGNDLDHEKCNVNPCSFWSEWGEWSSCSATCGTGAVKRWRDCVRTNLPRGNFPRLGLLASPCPGIPQESKTCQIQECPKGT